MTVWKGARFWLQVFSELKNRGVKDVLIAVCDGIVKVLKPVYTAPSEAAMKDRFDEFAAEWGGRYPAIVKLEESAWAKFVPFLEHDVEIRRVICTTKAIESINARYQQSVRARAPPNETAAVKCVSTS